MYTAPVMQRINRKFAFFIFQLLLVLIGLGVALAFYYSTSFYLIGDFVYNSDSLYLPALYADMIHGNNLAQWNLPPSSYLFPDMVLYFILRAYTPNLQAAAVAFGITQYLIFALGLMLLAKQLLPRVYGSIIPALIALMSLCFTFSLTNLEFYIQMIFVSAHHFGIVLVIPFVLAITHTLMSESKLNLPIICLLSALSFLTALSDWLYLVQLAIPLVASLAILHKLKKTDLKRILVIASAILAPSLIGQGASLFYIWDHPQLVAYMLRPQPIDSSIQQLAASLTTIPLYHSILAVVFLGICAFIFARVIARIFLRQASGLDLGIALLPTYFFLAFIINTVSVIGSGIFADRDGFRYFLPVLIFSGFWGLPFIVPPIKAIKPIFFESGVTGALVLLILVGWGNIDSQGFIFDYYPPFIQCIDEKTSTLGIRYGIADYWQARPISLLSHNNLQVVQVNHDLSPYHWINNSAEYKTEPEFAVIDARFPENYPFRLDENLITSRFGKPDAMFECEDNRILVYDHSNNKFRFLFSDACKNNIPATLIDSIFPITSCTSIVAAILYPACCSPGCIAPCKMNVSLEQTALLFVVYLWRRILHESNPPGTARIGDARRHRVQQGTQSP